MTKPTPQGEKATKLQEEISYLIELRIKRNGLKMSKEISSAGLFHDVVFDERRAFSLKELFRLSGEGFKINSEDNDLGLFLLNSFVVKNL